MLLLLLACTPDPPVVTPPDLTARLGPGEARAGVVVDDASLFGGSAAEGQLGDLLLYNDRARFVLQGDRPGDYLTWQGGAVVDADVVRPEGQPGRDLLDEWSPVVGVGQLMALLEAQIVSDGSDGGPAVVRVAGPETKLDYLTGALESSDVLPDQGLWFETTWTLPPDSPLMKVETVVTATRGPVTFTVGDVLVGAGEAGALWVSGVGRVENLPEAPAWVGFVGERDELALGMFPEPGEALRLNRALDTMNMLVPVAGVAGEEVTLAAGESTRRVRYYGVAEDPAALTDAWLALAGVQTRTEEGRVTAGGAPVAGARVNVGVDGAPWSLAFTDAEGAFALQVPAAADVTLLAEGRGVGLFTDLPEGAAPYGPYSAAPARAAALDSLRGGALPVPSAQGYGVADPAEPLTLVAPARLTLRNPDGLPFEARLRRRDAEPAVDAALVRPRPQGWTALAWARAGEVTVALEPGTYDVLVHHGVRYELFTGEVTLAADEAATLEAPLALVVDPEGWLVGDPHAHAAPSPDGKLPMRERLMVHAGVGVQLYFGTDHDHVVDYSPLADAMGLTPALSTIVASEVSPVLRGHLNAYPLQPDPTAGNNGAWPWWRADFEDTEEELAQLRAHYPEAIIQSNHPMSGLASLAGWSPGRIAEPDHWSDDIDAVEVLNGGDAGEAVDFYLDLVNHGLRVAPVGVSDSHRHLSGMPGLSVTWLGVGGTGPEHVVEAFHARRTVASLGPFVALSVDPGAVVGPETTLTARALSPSWIVVDRLRLLRDGVEVDRADGVEASWVLNPEADASYVVIAEGDRAMQPLSGRRPWAMTGAVFVDVDGQGWVAPGGDLVLE